MSLFVNVLLRILATFVASALGVIGAGSIAGMVSNVEIPIWFSAVMGGVMAVAKVVELLSLAFLEDGKITKNEINAAFRQTVAIKDVEPEQPSQPKKNKNNNNICETCGQPII